MIRNHTWRMAGGLITSALIVLSFFGWLFPPAEQLGNADMFAVMVTWIPMINVLIAGPWIGYVEETTREAQNRALLATVPVPHNK